MAVYTRIVAGPRTIPLQKEGSKFLGSLLRLYLSKALLHMYCETFIFLQGQMQNWAKNYTVSELN